MTDTLSLSDIRTDAGTQPRAGTDTEVVKEYAEALQAGAKLPPVTVFHDGDTYILADGFHRYAAHGLIKRRKIGVDIKQGTARDAKEFSLGANKGHGLRRSPGDKRRAIETMLRDDEWVTWSDNRIAAHIGVSQTHVSNIRRELGLSISAKSAPRVTASGRTINTANIGRKPATVGDADVRQDAPDDDMPVRDIDAGEDAEDITEQASADKAEAAAPAPEAAFTAPVGTAADDIATTEVVTDPPNGGDTEGHEQGQDGECPEDEPGTTVATLEEPRPPARDVIRVTSVAAAGTTLDNDPVTLSRAEYEALVKRAEASPWLKVGVPLSAIQHCCSLLRSATKAITPEDAVAQYTAAMYSDDITRIAEWFARFDEEFRETHGTGNRAALEAETKEAAE